KNTWIRNCQAHVLARLHTRRPQWFGSPRGTQQHANQGKNEPDSDRDPRQVSALESKKTTHKVHLRLVEVEVLATTPRSSKAFCNRSTLASTSPRRPGRISAFTTSDTREPYCPTASVACLMTLKTSSHSPSIVVNIASTR